MLRSGILLSFILISSARIFNTPDITHNENYEEENWVTIPKVDGSPMWVLKLHGSSKMELKLASSEEEKDFEESAGPMIDNYKKKQALRKSVSRPQVMVHNETVGMEDILKLLNKFLLYSNVEPDSYLTETHEDPTIALYFKSPYALLTVNADTNQWHYFISPPSSLPSWFYEDHTSAMQTSGTVPIPDEVKQRLYETLLRYLRALLKFHI